MCWGKSKQLRLCLFFFEANGLADLLTADGRHISLEVWQGKDGAHKNPSNAVQKAPKNKLRWNLWREALSFLVIGPFLWRLKRPLGPWIDCVLMEESALCSSSEDRLFVGFNQVWVAHERKRPSRSGRRNPQGVFSCERSVSVD